MRQQDVQAAGGPSLATMRLIEGGLQHGYRSLILRRLEKALRWEEDSVEAILNGGQPTIASDTSPTGRPEHRTSAPEIALRILAFFDDPEVDDGQKDLMEAQMRLWGAQIDAEKAAKKRRRAS